MTAGHLRELLLIADESARKAMASARALLSVDYNHGRLPGKHKVEAAFNLLTKMIPTFGSLGFADVVWTDSELRIIERRICPAYYHPAQWRVADNEPCIGLGTLWLTAGRDGLQVGSAVEMLFRLEAIDQWFSMNPGPNADYGGRPKSWPNPPIIFALNCESEWLGDMVDGVRMVSDWAPAVSSSQLYAT